MRPVLRGALVFALAFSGCKCSKGNVEVPAEAAPPPREQAIADPRGLSAPIAATHLDGGEVVVAGLDVPGKGIRVQKVRDADEVVIDRIVLDDVKWVSDAELKVAPAGKGVVVTWRGLRGEKLVRQIVVLGPDLEPTSKPTTVSAASCATRDAVWLADAKGMRNIPFAPVDAAAPLGVAADVETSIVCGAKSAFALIDGEEGTSAIVLGGDGKTIRLLREHESDETRERAEYIEGDTLGVVRLAASGTLTVRELALGKLAEPRVLDTKIQADDDIVAVDASPRVVAVAFTSDASTACDAEHATKISAVRADRKKPEEATLVLSEGACGRETGPFFTSAFGDEVMVAWVERMSTERGARPPIAGLAWARVPPEGTAATVSGRIEQEADALVDAGCTRETCYAVALARGPARDAMAAGVAKVLRYPR